MGWYVAGTCAMMVLGKGATYMSESFPPGVRGTAVGTSYNIGRIGSTISPILIGRVATDYTIGLGNALLGFSYALRGLIPGLFICEKMFDPKACRAPRHRRAATASGRVVIVATRRRPLRTCSVARRSAPKPCPKTLTRTFPGSSC